MTKERRLAIEMWERIVEELENGKLNVSPSIMVDDIKTRFCMSNNLHWKCNCWFCQYVRHDYRPMKSREYIQHESNGCQNCPLYKEHGYMLDDDECGCTHRVNTLWNRVSALGDASAAKYIAKLLKGKYLGTRKEIENDKI